MNAWKLTLDDTYDDSFSTGTIIEAKNSNEKSLAVVEVVSGSDGVEGEGGAKAALSSLIRHSRL